MQGGPDYWDARTKSAAAKVYIHLSPSAAAKVVGNLAGGTVVRNLGCRMLEARRWCRVETLGAPRMSGWTAGEFLRESSYPGIAALGRDARVPGTKFHATGNIPCARYAGQPMSQCRFGVARNKQGNGAVTVFWPDGGDRVIFFENGTPFSFEQLQADGDVRLTVDRNADLFTVTIGAQRFEIPEAVINGVRGVCSILVFVFIGIYVLALALFAIGTFGLFGSNTGPLAGIFLVPLGLPWNTMLDGFPEAALPWLAAASPLVNLCIIYAACYLIGGR